jgi:hypothetical protein
MPGEKVSVIDEQPRPVLQALYTFEGDVEACRTRWGADGSQVLRNLGTSTIDHKKPDPAFGKRSLVVARSGGLGIAWRSTVRASWGGISR